MYRNTVFDASQPQKSQGWSFRFSCNAFRGAIGIEKPGDANRWPQ
jgi:hypothetical protein